MGHFHSGGNPVDETNDSTKTSVMRAISVRLVLVEP